MMASERGRGWLRMAGPAPGAHASPAPWQRLADASRVAWPPLPCFHEQVNVIVVEIQRGRDGKCYPVGGDLPVADRARAIKMAHNLICRGHLSYRAAQRIMIESYGLRRSIGQLHKDIHGYACRICEPEAFARPPG
jgi:hypothetical protein